MVQLFVMKKDRAIRQEERKNSYVTIRFGFQKHTPKQRFSRVAYLNLRKNNFQRG